jgi:hypothetical protein
MVPYGSLALGWPHELREETMKDRSNDILPEYDFKDGVRGKYAERFAEGCNVVILEPDVAARFPDSKAVNDALRSIADLDVSEPQ